ncbi:PepSY-associated TM helix domain-containing protein [Grimontia hollisae]|uniref:Uncharacterized iron-regulated membrane protein n=1 Tax=Grimontia hollisae TaxID=673 RepID=A0A377HPP4_GRIHO|nr:PepSY domain-containing protein [Grimontia hollisae]STO58139.1 Uncharacterized iron-regulated membrane protein [Grimontia hollisae]
MVSQTGTQSAAKAAHKSRYFTAWRWHFYAGLFVIPFMAMLSFTGVIMLFDDEIESVRYGELLTVTAQNETRLPSAQLAAVNAAFPDAIVTQFMPAGSPETVNRFSVRLPDNETRFVLVNPYTAEVVGSIDRSDSWYALANDIHGTLLLGDMGDRLIETAASFTILLLVSGLYLWWPKDAASRACFLKIRTDSGSRIFMRDLHTNLGGILSVVLLFFVISGLAWTGIWGGKIVQPWGSFPPERSKQLPESVITHQALNHDAEEEMPWNLEQTPVPVSHHGSHNVENTSADKRSLAAAISIDDVVSKARDVGFTQYRLRFPTSDTGVYTLSANTMSGDITDPTKDRTLHIDQYSGEVLADITFSDYNWMAKAMAAGIALHQGDISVINKVFNLFVCLVFLVISITGAIMWWKRRPQGSKRLGAPSAQRDSGLWLSGIVTLAAICLFLPLAGISVIAILCIDWLILRKLPIVRQAIR